MKNFWGKSNYWWLMLILGILVFAIGLWVILQPNVGYLIVAVALAYALLIGGVFQIAISTSLRKETKGWGWWLAGGIFDIFVGFLLIANPIFTESLLPFFFGFIFLYTAFCADTFHIAPAQTKNHEDYSYYTFHYQAPYYRIIQIKPLLPSLIILCKVSFNFILADSGILESLL